MTQAAPIQTQRPNLVLGEAAPAAHRADGFRLPQGARIPLFDAIIVAVAVLLIVQHAGLGHPREHRPAPLPGRAVRHPVFRADHRRLSSDLTGQNAGRDLQSNPSTGDDLIRAPLPKQTGH